MLEGLAVIAMMEGGGLHSAGNRQVERCHMPL